MVRTIAKVKMKLNLGKRLRSINIFITIIFPIVIVKNGDILTRTKKRIVLMKKHLNLPKN